VICGACSIHGRDEKFIQKTRDEVVWETVHRMEYLVFLTYHFLYLVQ